MDKFGQNLIDQKSCIKNQNSCIPKNIRFLTAMHYRPFKIHFTVSSLHILLIFFNKYVQFITTRKLVRGTISRKNKRKQIMLIIEIGIKHFDTILALFSTAANQFAHCKYCV